VFPGQRDPRGQGTGSSATDGQYEPEGHHVQMEEFAPEYVPAWHGCGWELPDIGICEQNVPAGQGMHALELLVLLK